MKRDAALALLAERKIDNSASSFFIHRDDAEVMKALVKVGLDPEQTSLRMSREHILETAYTSGDSKLFSNLLKAGASPNIPCSSSTHKEPFLFTVAHSSQKSPSRFLKAMVKYGVDLNVIHPSSGWSILHVFVTSENKLKPLKYLVENGALIHNPKVKIKSFVELVKEEYQKHVQYNRHWLLDEYKEKLDYVLEQAAL
ncbi:MAG: hypothetical protein MK212_16220 [Saprospiraceae bacterium]|nr:hypothetical protein [Saprospiraceae bacterium]